jgi:fumarate reductase flavoprotein subunit
MVDWLEAHGFEFDPAYPVVLHGHEPYGRPRTEKGVAAGKSVLALLERLLAPYLAGGRVRVLTQTRVERLLTEDERVVGVATRPGDVTDQSQRLDGIVSPSEFQAPVVVLTSGGFGSNPDLFERLSGGYRPVSVANAASTGDGIQLAAAMGAALTGEGIFQPTMGGFEDPDRAGRCYQQSLDTWNVRPVLAPQERSPWEIWVNGHGERFVSEDEPSVDRRETALKSQPDLRFWIIWDEATLRDAPSLIRAWSNERLREFAAEGRLVQVAPTVAELAVRAGLPPAALEATIADYNDAVARREPDPFGREHRPRLIAEPPFYAIAQHGITLLSWAGLRVDTDLRVLRPNGVPIPGLYAVGEVLGASTFMGGAFCGGMAVGPCLSLGRYLGFQLAKQVVVAGQHP